MSLLARDDDFEGRGGKGTTEAVWRVPPLAPFGRRPIIVDGHPCRATAILAVAQAGRRMVAVAFAPILAPTCGGFQITDNDGRPHH
jgi:hypothetical protein